MNPAVGLSAVLDGARDALAGAMAQASDVKQLLALAQAAAKHKSWVEAQEARLVALAAQAAERQGQKGWAAVEEHALRTAQTSFEARRLERAGRAGLEDPLVGAAQDRGELPVRCCDAIVSAARRVRDPQASAQVVECGLRLATYCPESKVRAGVERVAAHKDPEAFGRGHKEAAEQRNVRLRVKPLGMAVLRAYGPAAALESVMVAVDAAGRTLAKEDMAGGRSRTAEQRCFDAFAGAWSEAWWGGDNPPRSAAQLLARPHVLVRFDAACLAGLSDQPGASLGSGSPVAAEAARELAGDATWQALVTDAGRVVGLGERILPPGVVLAPKDWPSYRESNASYKAGPRLRLLLAVRDQGCVTPNCQAPAARCDVDHREPFDPSESAEEQTTGANCQLLCRGCHQRKTHYGWVYQHDPPTGQTTITTPNGHTSRPPP